MDFNDTMAEYEMVLLGYVLPTVAISTIVTNVFAMVAFGKGACSPTSVLLMSIAMADMIACISVSPHYIYVYAYSQTPIYRASFLWCASYGVSVIATVVTHTASIWLTVIFCIERYICICHPFRVKQICTVKKTIIIVCFVYLLAFIAHTWILCFIDGDTFDLYKNACLLTYSFVGFLGISNIIFRFAFCQTIPCALLAILTVKLICALRASRHFRREHLTDSAGTDSADTTRISAAIAVLFLIAELPFVVIFALDIYDLFTFYSVQRPYLKTVVIIFNTMLFIAYHFNFWIYCCMGSAFRRRIIRIFCSNVIRSQKNLLK